MEKAILIFLLMMIFSQCSAQKRSNKSLLNSFQVQELEVKKNLSKTSTLDMNSFYIALSYDFDDSISIFIDKKSLYNGRLNYMAVDSISTHFPFNRNLLRFSKDIIKSSRAKCQILFWKAKKKVDFEISRGISFYNFELGKRQERWYLLLGNVYPWPN